MKTEKGFLQGMLDVYMLVGFRHETSKPLARYILKLQGRELDEKEDENQPNKVLMQMTAINPNVEEYHRDDPEGELQGVDAALSHLTKLGFQQLGNAGSLRKNIDERIKVRDSLEPALQPLPEDAGLFGE